MTRNMGTPAAANGAEEDRSRACSEKTITSLDVEQSSWTNPVPGDVPPNGGYGWVCVACSFWINAHTWGINSVRSSFVCVNRTIADWTQDIRRFSFILPCAQPFPRCHLIGFCIRRWTFHLTSFACVPSRNLYHSRVRKSYHTAHWRFFGGTRPDKCLVCAADMAAISKPRRVLRVWYGISVCGFGGNRATMVHHKKEPGKWYFDRRERSGRDDLQLSF